MTMDDLAIAIEEHQGWVEGIARKARRDFASDAYRDLAQEIWVKVIRNLHRFDPEKTTFKLWLTVVARRVCTDHYRKLKTHPTEPGGVASFGHATSLDSMLSVFTEDGEDETGIDPVDPKPLPDAVVEKDANLDKIMEALDKIDPDFKEAYMLYTEGFTYEEIARKQHVATGTAKSRIARVKKEARMALGLVA